MPYVAKTVGIEATLALRRDVLRPGWDLARVASEDASADSPLYFALVDDATDEVVTTAMVLRRAPSAIGELTPAEIDGSYQLRAVATVADQRGRGLASALLSFVENEVHARGATVLWCNSHEATVGLYARFAMVVAGAPFEIEGIGTHQVMWKRLTK